MPEPDLLKRLLADAEEKAAEGRMRDGYVLLRWASRLAPRNLVPVVLLTYHRLRTAGQDREGEIGDRGVPRRRASGLDVSASFGGVTADALGFPVPRFPTRAPDLDRTAFVPAPARADDVRSAPPARPAHAANRKVRRRRSAWVALALAVTLVSVAPYWLVAARKAPDWIRGIRGDPADAAEAALRAGNPSRALLLTNGVADAGPRLLLVRGRAAILIGDTTGGCAALQSAAAHPQAEARQAWEAAELLESLPARESVAAEAYLRAFSLGLPPEKWPAVAQALDRDGHGEQAARVRALIPISARGSGQ